MKLFQIEFNKRDDNYDMLSPHTHDQYELYFLLQGTRNLLVQNIAFITPPKSLCVIPPFCLHKTSGGPHNKISIYIPKNLLSANEISFLNKCATLHSISISDEILDFYLKLINTAAQINSDDSQAEEYQLSLLKSLLVTLQHQQLNSAIDLSTVQDKSDSFDPLILEILQYLENHYCEKITLKHLCDKFFLSKAMLCRRFNKNMNCSAIDYLLNLRVNKAKHLLVFTKMSVEKISEECGFSSANYFGLIFKQLVGKSPFNYRKKQI